MPDIRGLRFTQKGIRLMGGPGSGHHGHTGRPGSVGGSTSKGLAMLMSNADWNGLSSVQKEMLTDDILRVPNEHLKKLNGIKLGAFQWRGLYDPYHREIKINPSKYQKGDLFHEVGHHVFEKFLSEEQKRKVGSEVSLSKMREALRYPDELFAELYKMQVQGNRKEEFVGTNTILDNLF